MTAFVIRSTEQPTTTELLEIEQTRITDVAAAPVPSGVGTGTVMIVGEYEDGPVNEPTEVFGGDDERARFGGFGFTRPEGPHRSPAARRHLGESWNGNGFLKRKFLDPPRMVVNRVDTSVGSVRFSPLASARTSPAPFRLISTDQMNVDIDSGGPVPTADLSVVTAAIVTGIDFSDASGYTGGEQIVITREKEPPVTIVFQSGDITAGAVVNRINQQFGAFATEVLTQQVRLTGLIVGAAGRITLADGTAGALAAIGLSAGTFSGVGTVAATTIQDMAAVTADELRLVVTNLAGVEGIVDSENRVIFFSATQASGTIEFTDLAGPATSLSTATGLIVDVEFNALIGEAISIPSGTRVSVGVLPSSNIWVTMQTLSIVEGTAETPNLAFYDFTVRPENDDGTAIGATAATVDTLVDVPDGRFFAVTNVGDLSAALTEPQLDAAYDAAFNAALGLNCAAVEVNHVLAARRSDAVIRSGRTYAINASNQGGFGRMFYARAPFGLSPSDAIADVAQYRSDQVFYEHPAWTVRISEIAVVGSVAGGTGFTDDGVILIGSDGPLARINAILPPEENPGQKTSLLNFVIGMENVGTLSIDTYKAYKKNGICAPRIVRGTPYYQSEVTSSLEPGRTTQKRRKFSFFVQDSVGIILDPFSKKMYRAANVEAAIGALEDFFEGLQSPNNPALQRIFDWSVQDTTTDALARQGIILLSIQVAQLPSIDAVSVTAEIGENVVIVRGGE